MSEQTDMNVDWFNHGYLVAVAKAVSNGWLPVGLDLLRESGLRLHHAEALGIEEPDLRALRVIFKILDDADRAGRSTAGRCNNERPDHHAPPAPLCYHEGETNRCPQCGNKGWHVGRVTAECSHCDHPLPLAQAVISGGPAEQTDH